MTQKANPDDYDGCAIPPIVYDIALGWDPRPEVNRLLFVARNAAVEVRSTLELGCGTGRLLPTIRESAPDVHALDLSPAVVRFAEARCGANLTVGDMSDFSLARAFDMIYASANTIRHVCDDDAIARMWRCIADHLEPNGVFIADLELGFAAEAEKLNKPARWTLSRGETLVRVRWEVIEPPSPETRCCTIRWTFESRGGDPTGAWSEEFRLRTYDAPEFVRFATAEGRLRLLALYELRDPYLIDTAAEKATGRFLVAFQAVEPG